MRQFNKLLLFLLLIPFLSFSQNIKTPAEFLGYNLGDKFSFHYRILDYVKYVESQKPGLVKVIPYGTTSEGRPLVYVAVANTENLGKLEEIRTNNLKSIGLMDGKPTAKVPPIAWLSYNVHGNEAVSSEAVMRVLYELVNPSNATTQRILKNTVVILDPCINPDGRDRYAQWYNRYVGKTPDLNLASVEHHEPWPGGRFNHYLFDMNRDWAWQTQHETRLRMTAYNSWMPHLHGDFHEMGPNSTYYFAPSARPYHEDLSKWQREFQGHLGDYNKKYFDENGWLYFTKESYDLFYPSYGDTYPSYNGAIGATYEQGGGGAAGLAYPRNDGDTLTLKSRIDHHYFASIGTLEAVSEKADKVTEEFVKFFDDPQKKGYGKYKSFVLKTAGKAGQEKALTELLDKLQIKYSYADKKQTLTGVNFSNHKDESFSVENNDLIVNTFQPKGTFVKVLFEPATALEDSNTYDITAWALPYAYGLKAYAVGSRVDGGKKTIAAPKTTLDVQKPVYAYIATWKSFGDAGFLAQLLKNKIKVRVHEAGFKLNGESYAPGTLLITRKGNEALGADFNKIVTEEAKKAGISLITAYSGMTDTGLDMGSSSVSHLDAPAVGFVLGTGVSATAAGDVWHYFEQQLNYPVTVIDQSYFSRIDLWKFNVLILPDGRYAETIRDTKEILRWVSDGGKLIIMEGATNFFAGKDGFELKGKKEKEKDDTKNLKAFGERERAAISDQIVGAIYKVNMDNTHPLAYGYDKEYYSLIKDVYDNDLLKNGWNVGYLDASGPVTGFTGKNAREKMKNVPVFAVQESGKGKIIYMMESPLFRGFWYNGKLLFANAVFMVN